MTSQSRPAQALLVPTAWYLPTPEEIRLIDVSFRHHAEYRCWAGVRFGRRVRLIPRTSQVQILPPLPLEGPFGACEFLGEFDKFFGELTGVLSTGTFQSRT